MAEEGVAKKFALEPDEARRRVYLRAEGSHLDLRFASIQMNGIRVRHAFRKGADGWYAEIPHTALAGHAYGQLEVMHRDDRLGRR